MANFNFNKVILGGRLTADPELKTTQSGVSVTSFSIAVDRRFARNGEERQADFINCTAWRQQAELITRYFRKGSSICVVGNLQTRDWTDNNGNKRYVTEVIVDEVCFVDSKGENPAASQSGNTFANMQAQPYVPESYGTPAFATSASSAEAPKFEEITDDDELPF